MQKIKVLTHTGNSHMDECSAIALLKLFFEVELTRSYTIPDNWGGWVLDIGREYDPLRLRFDHHQNAKLDASNMLVRKHLADNNIMPIEFYFYIEDIFQKISNIDTGTDEATGIDINSIANIMCDTYEKKQAYCDQLLTGLWNNFKKSEKLHHAMLNNIEMVHDIPIFINEDAELDRFAWRTVAKELDVLAMITPSSRGGFNLVVRSSRECVILPDDNQTFLHNSGFLAAYPTLNMAILGVQKIKYVTPIKPAHVQL